MSRGKNPLKPSGMTARPLRPESEIQQSSADLGQLAGWWHAEDAAATEWEVSELVAALVRALQPEIAVEMGCYRGQTSALVGNALVFNGHGHLYAIDNDAQRIWEAADATIGLPVTVIHTDARQWVPPGPVDFAFIDTGDPADRITDILHILPHCSPAGVLAIHDSGTRFGLRARLKDLVREGVIEMVSLPTPRGIAIARAGVTPLAPWVPRASK